MSAGTREPPRREDRPIGPRRGGQGGGRPRARAAAYTLGPPSVADEFLPVRIAGSAVSVAGAWLLFVTSWREFGEQAPGLAARVFDRFEAHRHKTMATIR